LIILYVFSLISLSIETIVSVLSIRQLNVPR
jgi:hypothetical protein